MLYRYTQLLRTLGQPELLICRQQPINAGRTGCQTPGGAGRPRSPWLESVAGAVKRPGGTTAGQPAKPPYHGDDLADQRGGPEKRVIRPPPSAPATPAPRRAPNTPVRLPARWPVRSQSAHFAPRDSRRFTLVLAESLDFPAYSASGHRRLEAVHLEERGLWQRQLTATTGTRGGN